jgi:hypothetical protein
MKKLLFLSLLFVFNLNAQNAPDLIIRDINVLTMKDNQIQKKQSVAIKDGKIVGIGKYKKIPQDKHTKVINGKGKYLMPGLAEMHSHLPKIEAIDTFLLENVAAGITHLRVMNTEMEQLPLKKRLENDANAISPQLHFCQIVRKEHQFSEVQCDSLMYEIKKNGLSFIKLFSVADEATFDNLMRSANRNKVMVAGHFPSMVSMEKVLNSGFRSIEHLGGYDKIKDSTALMDALILSKNKFVFNCPTLDWDVMAANLAYPDAYKKRLVFDFAPKKMLEKWETDYKNAITVAGEKEELAFKEKYFPLFRNKQKILKMMADNGNLLLLGSDPGGFFQMHGFNVHEEMMIWAGLGIDNYTILKSATVSAALFFQEEQKWGTIELGKSADLIILDQNPLVEIRNITSVEKTIVKGKVFERSFLMSKI